MQVVPTASTPCDHAIVVLADRADPQGNEFCVGTAPFSDT
jgi:hypothetical protein